MFCQNGLKQISEKNIVKPNKLMGQNFLRDKNVLRKIISAANLTDGDIVLEVGPGEGILTDALTQSAGRIIAVEKDKNLAARLKEKFVNSENVKIVEGDILKLFNRIIEQLNNCRYKVVANIPYYLTSHLIRLLLESANPPQDIILMIQKEVAKRVCARPPKMSLLAASVQFYAQPKIISSVSKNAFWPRPKVDSAIIKITPHQNFSRQITPASFFNVIRAGFSHPRKQLLNNLSSALKIPRERAVRILQSAGIKPAQRAETLNVENWIKITDSITSQKSAN